jgi:hypothetical protein
MRPLAPSDDEAKWRERREAEGIGLDAIAAGGVSITWLSSRTRRPPTAEPITDYATPRSRNRKR